MSQRSLRGCTAHERLAFWSRPTANGCREWNGLKDEKGYLGDAS